MSDRHLIAYEHQNLRRSDSGGLSQGQYEALYDASLTVPSGALSLIHNGLRTGSYCGLIQHDGWSLEILPKIFTRAGAGPNRGLLVEMLGLCFDMPVWQDGLADADHSDDLLQVVLNAFVRECRQLGRKGWQKGYKEVEERLSFPRGRILITDQIRRGRAGAHQLDCRFSELTIDTPHNQAILAGIVAGCRLARPWSRVERQLHSLAEELGTVSRIETTGEAIGRLPLDKLTARYERALMLAGWLVGDAGSDVHNGDAQGLNLLFDMNLLFQEVLGVALSAAISRHPLASRLRLLQERPRRCLVTDASKQPVFSMKPDFCITIDGNVVAILDAKWKVLKPDEAKKAGVNEADMYQLLAYGHTYSVQRLFLIYPFHDGLIDWQAKHFKFAPHTDASIQIRVSAFNLTSLDDEADKLLSQALNGLWTPPAPTPGS